MPFQSRAQQRFMFSQHPDIAKEFAAKTPNINALPERKGKKKHTQSQQAAIARKLNGASNGR